MREGKPLLSGGDVERGGGEIHFRDGKGRKNKGEIKIVNPVLRIGKKKNSEVQSKNPSGRFSVGHIKRGGGRQDCSSAIGLGGPGFRDHLRKVGGSQETEDNQKEREERTRRIK